MGRRLGELEKELLYDISNTGLLVGFLMSGRSTKRMYQIARDFDTPKQKAEFKRRRRRALRTLEEKGLVVFVNNTYRLTSEAEHRLVKQRMKETFKHKKAKWDQKWRVVMFDFPEEESPLRLELRRTLVDIGFVQVQLSVYAFPYPIQELQKYIESHPVFRQHCHIIEGAYLGDDSGLRNVFKLK